MRGFFVSGGRLEKYDPKTIEAKWQRVWEDERAFYVANPEPGAEPGDEFYMLEMLPYPSGNLHMGHVLNYTLGDVVTHFKRRQGLNVLRPMGYDSFGLPAENAAIKEGGNPREITERNIASIERQMRRLGWAIDWDRVIAAHDPAYYHWTQWLFLKFFEKGLAFRKEAPVNWCPNDQTVLANEQVIDGRCERCGAEVEARKMEQWFFRITAYADALLDDHALLDWPDRTITIQRNWIGRSEGAELLFRIEELDVDLPVFTTRPDTVFGATFCVLAPEHPLVDRLVERSPNADELREYVRRSMAKRGEVRAAAEEKTGVFTGFYAVNPATGEPIPIWVADYVLMEYGTGAIMAVPGHDERDREYRGAVRAAGRDGDRRGRQAGRLGPVRRPAGRRGQEGDRGVARRAGPRPAGGQLPPARLGLLAPALLGLPDPDRLLRAVRRGAGAGGGPARPAAGGRGLPPEGQAAARLERGVAPRALSALRRPRRARGRHDGHLRRLVVVLPALRRPAQRPGAVRALARRLLAAGRPVRGRDRPRHRPPALLAVLRQGAERAGDAGLPRALPAALPPGLGSPGRLEDVEVARERDRARPAGRHVRGRRRPPVHPLRRAGGSGHGLDRGGHRGDRPLPAAAVADRRRGSRCDRTAATAGRSCARPTRRSRG